jgi:hypothetical protein
MFRLFSSFFLLFPLCLFAQKNDYNWVLNSYTRLDFHNKSVTYIPDSCIKEHWNENECSFSDTAGRLLFYIKYCGRGQSVIQLRDADNQLIPNSDGIFCYYSATNGSSVVVVNDSIIHLITIYYNERFNKRELYYSTLKVSPVTGKCRVIRKNWLLLRTDLSEKIACVKHSDMKRWWIVCRGGENTDSMFVFLADHLSIDFDHVETVGTKMPIFHGLFSESCFSEAGDKLLSVLGCEVIDVFDFDRCTGRLSNHLPLGKTAPPCTGDDHFFYGCSFSPDGIKIYVSEYSGVELYQYDLSAKDVKKSRKRLIASGGGLYQHQLGPDGKIYINVKNGNRLIIIHQPNLAGKACQIDTAGIKIKEDGLITSGLPNFPNYRLPDYIVAFAGKDTMLCAGESLRLGQGIPNPKLIYEWTPKEGLDDPNSPNPWATPNQTTAYVLTVRPLPSVPEACRSRPQHSDTVLVRVIEKHVPPCTSVSRPELPKKFFAIYPNPANDLVTLHYQIDEGDYAQAEIYNMQGIRIKVFELTTQTTEMNLELKDLTAGIYTCKITVNGFAYETLKLIIE